MRFSSTIRSILAFALLVIFVFSSTPKLVIHNLFAHHKDQHYGVSKDKRAMLGAAVFNCHTEDLVVAMPYLSFHFAAIEMPVLTVRVNRSSLVYPFFQQHHFFAELRGPPAIA